MDSHRRVGGVAGALAILAALVACASESDGAPPGDDAGAEAGIENGAGALDRRASDASAEGSSSGSTCATTAPFASVEDLTGVSAYSVTLRADELELFAVGPAGVLQRATRADRNVAFGALAPVDLASPAEKLAVSLSDDGLSLYLTGRVTDAPAPAHTELFVAKRPSLDGAFGVPAALTLESPPTTAIVDIHVEHDLSGIYLTFIGGGAPLTFRATLPSGTLTEAQQPDAGVFVTGLSETRGGVPTRDGLNLFTGLREPGGGVVPGTRRLALATRAAPSGSFAGAALLASPPHAMGNDQRPVWLSPDQCRLYFLTSVDESANVSALKVAVRAP